MQSNPPCIARRDASTSRPRVFNQFSILSLASALGTGIPLTSSRSVVIVVVSDLSIVWMTIPKVSLSISVIDNSTLLPGVPVSSVGREVS